MLTKRQNFLETIRGGNPDRYVNQYEYMNIILGTPFFEKYPTVAPGQMNYVGAWGLPGLGRREHLADFQSTLRIRSSSKTSKTGVITSIRRR